MTTISNRPFDSAILADVRPFAAPSSAALRSDRKARASKVPEVSVSLWRESMKEETGNRVHRRVVRGFFVVIGALGLGSADYAAWQTCVLMSGSTLHYAVAAFVR